MKLAIICSSEIALRRFMPALTKRKDITFLGVGVSSDSERFEGTQINQGERERVIETDRDKASEFVRLFGGRVFNSYNEVVTCEEADAVYIPLPPSLHYRWALRALQNNKHVLVEKPATLSCLDTAELISQARKRMLSLHENYMFVYHSQLNEIKNIIESGTIGEVRLIRVNFGFPRRNTTDFRYSSEMGGGALFDAGGYTLKLARVLMGDSVVIKSAQMNFIDEFEVDMYGSGTIMNANGTVAQISFGMDNNYRCELDVWGSKGSITTGRILTAPTGYVPKARLRIADCNEEIQLPEDDAFSKSIAYFTDCIDNTGMRESHYSELLLQAKMMDDFKSKASYHGRGQGDV